MSARKKAIIIGAGPAGLIAALRFLQSTNILPVIYEIRPAPSSLGGAVGIPANGLRLLHRLGVYDDLIAKGVETQNLILHSLNGKILGMKDLGAWTTKKIGFGYLRIRRTDLMEVLLSAARRAGIEIHYNKRLVSIQEEDNLVKAYFSDDTHDTGDFLLGCDGIHSSVRGLYVDPECEPVYSGISNVFSLLSVSDLPSKMLSPPLNDLNATMTSDGIFALSPATAERDLLYWFFSREIPMPVSSDGRDGWEERGKQEIEDLKSTLMDLFGDAEGQWLDFLRDVVRATKVFKFYPVYRMPIGRAWFKGRCLLIGDAAHAMPPHASQGVSMALEDVFLLSQLLNNDHGILEDLFKTFETKRKLRTEEMLRTAERNGTIRKKRGTWHLWAEELVISVALWFYHRLGLGQKDLIYDVEQDA